MWYIKTHKMKKLLLAIFILFSFSIFSQNFVQDNKQWNVIIEAFGPGGVSSATEIFYTSGDTVINEYSYSKVYRSGDSLLNSYYNGAIREENNKVFYVNSEGEEGLLYDFNLETDDTTYIVAIDWAYGYDSLMLIVDSIDYVEIGGMERKRMWIHNNEYFGGLIDYWIEGIGSNNGLLYTFVHNYWICPSWQLSCCYENGELIFQHEYLDCYANNVGIDEFEKTEINVYPNPINKGGNLLIHIPNESPISLIECFDLSGRVIFRKPIDLGFETNIQIPELINGIFFLKMTSKNGKSIIKKIIVN